MKWTVNVPFVEVIGVGEVGGAGVITDGAEAGIPDGVLVAVGVWQPKAFTSKTTPTNRPSRSQVGFFVT